jgi:hypothetical protein
VRLGGNGGYTVAGVLPIAFDLPDNGEKGLSASPTLPSPALLVVLGDFGTRQAAEYEECIFEHTIGLVGLRSSLSKARDFALVGLAGRSSVTLVDVALGDKTESGGMTREGEAPLPITFEPFIGPEGTCVYVSDITSSSNEMQ